MLLYLLNLTVLTLLKPSLPLYRHVHSQPIGDLLAPQTIQQAKPTPGPTRPSQVPSLPSPSTAPLWSVSPSTTRPSRTSRCSTFVPRFLGSMCPEIMRRSRALTPRTTRVSIVTLILYLEGVMEGGEYRVFLVWSLIRARVCWDAHCIWLVVVLGFFVGLDWLRRWRRHLRTMES